MSNDVHAINFISVSITNFFKLSSIGMDFQTQNYEKQAKIE